MLKRQELPATLTAMVMPLAEVVTTVENQLCKLDARVYEACAGERAAQCMMTVPGVGPVVAGMFLSVIDDAKRFRSARQVTSYLGLVPRETVRAQPDSDSDPSPSKAIGICAPCSCKRHGTWYVKRMPTTHWRSGV